MYDSNSYDYIIAGAGAAGLSLVWRLLNSSVSFSKVLLVDEKLETDNSKTWCFWADSDYELTPFIKKRWSHLQVRTGNSFLVSEEDSYSYYAVSSGNFSQYILNLCRKSDKVDMVEGHIEEIRGDIKNPEISINDTTYQAHFIFQSCFYKTLKEPAYPLGQHFIGWDIETPNNVFDESCVTLMDFDLNFNGNGTAFMYLLPWSEQKALLEYTIFSPEKEEKALYEQKIIDYLLKEYQLSGEDYRITRKERGFIPMEDRTVASWYANRVLTIGFPSGISKPSTGYTFKNIQEQTKYIIRQFENGRAPAPLKKRALKYRIYDLLLLQILYEGTSEECLAIFESLFTYNKFQQVFTFLDEDTSFSEDLKIMSSVPYVPFLKAIYATSKQIFE